MFEAVLAAIEEHNSIIIHRHKTPDGDALGSQLGLKYLLEENFPEKTIYVVGDQSKFSEIMGNPPMDCLEDQIFSDSLCILLDTSAQGLISDQRFTLSKATVRIDHHLFISKIAQIEVVDSSFESCCGLITQFAMESGLRLNPQAARALYTGMCTDSGRFRYDATTARTFRLAAFLMEQEFDLNEVYRNLYADDLQQKKLKAYFVQKIQTVGNVAYIYTDLAEFAALNTDVFTVSRGMVNTMADLKGIDIWVNFTETENGVLCELRSNRHSINPIAAKYGGGGHAKASGATVASKEIALQMLQDLREINGETL